ncbi:chaperone NapD [Agaribacterium sp. ZY112]|uniref:chaperone NapD n=1 Tax=Agaribacterium sp. ZY112 TaxID=3233574 RepID=UPI003524C2A3
MGETHISSVIVYFQPESAAAVQQYIESFDNAEFHRDDSHEGKAIAVFECPSLHHTKVVIEELQQQQGVVNVSMIYHHAEDNDALEEKIA